MILKILIKFIFLMIMIWLIGFFLSNQMNPMLWPVYGKLFALFFTVYAIGNSLED